MADRDTEVSAELAQLRGAMDNGFKSLEVSLALVAKLADFNRRSLEQVDDRVATLETGQAPKGS